LPECPGRLWSLRDIMHVFKPSVLLASVMDLQRLRSQLQADRSVHGGGAKVSTERYTEVFNLFRRVEHLCEEHGFTNAGAQAGLTINELEPESDPEDISTVLSAINRVSDSLHSEVWPHTFILVRTEHRSYVDNANLLGNEVATAFPRAVDDIMQAGNCIAAGCSTAAVFHMARIVEWGLRALANDRRITIPKNKPLDLATWEDVIRELEKAENAIQGYPKTRAREAQYAFYHGALMELKRFKNIVRNPIMHTRDDFDEFTAARVFTHVKGFMEILAKRISETARTPRIWKGKKWVTV